MSRTVLLVSISVVLSSLLVPSGALVLYGVGVEVPDFFGHRTYVSYWLASLPLLSGLAAHLAFSVGPGYRATERGGRVIGGGAVLLFVLGVIVSGLVELQSGVRGPEFSADSVDDRSGPVLLGFLGAMIVWVGLGTIAGLVFQSLRLVVPEDNGA